MSDTPAAPVGPCAPWATVEDVPAGSSCRDLDPYLLDDAFAVATELLWSWDGRKLAGLCETIDARPCSRNGRPTNAPVWFSRGWAGEAGRPWSCGCGNLARSCSCDGPSEVDLGAYPIVEILQVRVDGEVLDPAAYRVDDGRWLVRLPDPDDTLGRRRSWPCCQRVDLPSTDEGTWAVDFTYGQVPTRAAVRACVALACYLARGWDGDESCRLPDTVTSYTREGTTVQIQRPGADVLEQLPRDVRLFLDASNPTGQHAGATVWSPDVGTIRIPGT